MPVLSIISGAYNLESCFSFKNSIESILSQSFSDFEFIICDDGSTDGTYEILSEYAKGDERIVLLRNEKNLGLAATLNRCFSVAKGDFIARHDLDDYSAKDRLEKQITYLEAHPDVGMLGTWAYLFDGDGIYDTVKFPLTVTTTDFLFNSPYQHGSVVFRRDVLEKAGGYTVSKATRRTEDYELFMRIALFSRGENLSEPLYHFLEDEKTLKRRKYRYRIDEMKVRFSGFRALGLLPKGFFYVIKPLIVGLIPLRVLKMLRKKRRQQRNDEL